MWVKSRSINFLIERGVVENVLFLMAVLCIQGCLFLSVQRSGPVLVRSGQHAQLAGPCESSQVLTLPAD